MFIADYLGNKTTPDSYTFYFKTLKSIKVVTIHTGTVKIVSIPKGTLLDYMKVYAENVKVTVEGGFEVEGIVKMVNKEIIFL